MSWVIICSALFTHYPSQKEAIADFEKFPEVVSKESCSSPEEISKEELRSLKESGSFGIELDSLSLVYEKTKDSKDPEVQGPFPEKSHCSYSFIYIAPHVLKMLTKCGN